MKDRTRNQILLTVVLTSMAARAMAASVPCFDVKADQFAFTEYILDGAGTNGMYGWSFAVSQPVTVTAIGWYDDGQDGLSRAHQVGVWEGGGPGVAGSLLGQVTVPSGAAVPLDGFYRVFPAPPGLTLEPGHHYNVGGTYNPPAEDAVKYVLFDSGTPPSAAPQVLAGCPTYAVGGEFRVPEIPIAVYGLELGPMLFIEEIPEPSTAQFLLWGLFGFLLARHGKRATASPLVAQTMRSNAGERIFCCDVS